MMRIITVVFSCTLSILIGCTAAVHRADNAAPEVKGFFGEKIIGIIDGAESAASFKVKSEKLKVPAGKNIHGYSIIASGPVLSSSQLSDFKNILLDAQTYDFKWAKKSFLFPEYAVVFKKGTDELILLIDFYRKEFLFVYNGKELVEDFDNAEMSVKKIVEDLFR